MRTLIYLILLSFSLQFSAIASIKTASPTKENIRPQNDIEYLQKMVKKLNEKQLSLQESGLKKERSRNEINAPKTNFENLEDKYFDDITIKQSAPTRIQKKLRER